MRKRKFLALFALLLVASLAITACGSAAVAPAPAASAPQPAWDGDVQSFGVAPTIRASGGAAMSFSEVMETEAYWAEDSMELMPMADAPVAGGESDPAVPAAGGRDAGQPATTQRMIVTTFDLVAETMDFDSSTEFIRSLTHEFGGFIGNSSEDGRSHFDEWRARSAFFTLRIPSGHVHEFVAVLGESTNIIRTSEFAEDITESYFDNRARLDSLINQESLLTGLLESEGAGLEYILEVHRELSNVRHQIEVFNSIIQRQGQAVSLSTVHISIQEVMQYRPVDDMPTSFGVRISQAAYNSWNNFVRQTQNMVVSTIWQLPFFFLSLLRIAFWVAVFLIIRKLIRKKKGRMPGENTFDWLPVSRIRKGKAPENPGTENDSV